ncbi:MAG: hypothetical protein WAN46_01160, partial [Gammaproteobacteria bacterium]
PCRLESSIPAEHTLVARQLTAYRFRARFYPLNGDADETMTMAHYRKGAAGVMAHTYCHVQVRMEHLPHVIIQLAEP